MPIHLDSDENIPPVRPGTNAHEVMSVLSEHPDMGFSPTDLTELTDVPRGSIHKTLSRLREKGLVRKVDTFWTLADDVAGSTIANVVSLEEIESVYGDDDYGNDDGWATDTPDLGENA